MHHLGTPQEGHVCESMYNCQDYSLVEGTWNLDAFDGSGYYYFKICSGNNKVESEEKKIYLGDENDSKKLDLINYIENYKWPS